MQTQGGGIIAGIVIFYLISTTVIGTWSVKYSKDTNRFMRAKGQLGTYLIGMLLISEFVATASTMGTSQAAFETGLSSAWVYISLSVGFILYAFLLAGKYNAMQEYTISGIIGQKYGEGARFIVSLIAIYALMVVVVVAYTGGAVVLGTFLNIKTTTAVWIIAVAASVCVAAGGIRGVGFANLIHFLFKYAALVITAIVAWRLVRAHPGSWESLPATHFSMTGVGISQIVAWTIGNIATVFSTQYVIQTISSLKSPEEAKKASIFAALWLAPLGFIAAYIGLAARALFPTIKSVRALPEFLKYMNPWLAGIVATGLLAVAFVTILACHLGATALVMKDFYMPLFKPGEKHQIQAVRMLALVLGLLPVPFALYVPALLKTVFFARALRASLTVIVLFGFYAPRIGTKRGATIGLVLSVLFTTIWFVLKDPFGIDNMYIAVATPLICLLVSNVFRKTSPRGPRPLKSTAGEAS
ncbi:MAG: sodium:solute symporter family protein [Candidatus Korobacteraceae bacterium]|jgi:SSS family solute:Na+ symporter